MDFKNAVAWIEDAVTDLLPLVTGELLPEEKALVEAIEAAITAYKAG